MNCVKILKKSTRLGRAIGEVATLLDSIRKVVENADSVLPVDARISDADTVLETSLALGGDFLGACQLLA